MPIDILAEADAVAAARWRATEPAAARASDSPSPSGRTAPAPDAVTAGDANEADPWLVRQGMRLDERLLVVLVLFTVLVRVGTTVLTTVALW